VAFARGGLHLIDSSLNPQHINGLPAEVRDAVAHMCRSAQAEDTSLFSELAGPCFAFWTPALRWRPCDAGKIVREARVVSEPEALLQVLTNTIYRFKRAGLEAGPLSQWLYSVLAEAGLPVQV